MHGIKGAVKCKIQLENPADISEYQLYTKQGDAVNFKLSHIHKQQAVLFLEQCHTRNEAEKQVGNILYTPASQLSSLHEGEFYINDLIGCEVVSEQGNLIGTIHYMHDFGAGDIMEIAYQNGKTEMFAFNETTVLEVDLENNKLVVNLPEIEFASEEGSSEN